MQEKNKKTSPPKQGSQPKNYEKMLREKKHLRKDNTLFCICQVLKKPPPEGEG